MKKIQQLLFLLILGCCESFVVSSAPSGNRWPSSLLPLSLSSTPSTDVDRTLASAKHALLRIAAAASMLPVEVFTTPPMMEPPSAARQTNRKAVSEALEEGWLHLDGFGIPEEELTTIDNAEENDSNPSTYGEITELGVRQLLYYMKVSETPGEEGVSFLDLGSGVGKLVAQVYMEVPNLSCVRGIELAPTRHAAARQAWNRIESSAGTARDQIVVQSGNSGTNIRPATVELLQGDLFELDISNVTHIYVASLCFSPPMMLRLAEKLATEKNPCLQCIATLKRFPEEFENVLGQPQMEYVEMTWTQPFGAQVFFYRPSSR